MGWIARLGQRWWGKNKEVVSLNSPYKGMAERVCRDALDAAARATGGSRSPGKGAADTRSTVL